MTTTSAGSPSSRAKQQLGAHRSFDPAGACRGACRGGGSLSTPALPTGWESSRASLGQRRDNYLQRRRCDRADNPHPSTGHKFYLDRPRCRPTCLDQAPPQFRDDLAVTKPISCFGSDQNNHRIGAAMSANPYRAPSPQPRVVSKALQGTL